MSYNHSSSFSNLLNAVTSTPSQNNTSNYAGNKTTSMVKDTTGAGAFSIFSGVSKSEKQVSTEPKGKDQASVVVQDTSQSGAWSLLTGTVPERRYNATQLGEKVVVQETANAGSSWWNIFTGNK
jgi:hypothetical protein